MNDLNKALMDNVDSINLTKAHLETIDTQLEMFMKAYGDKFSEPMTTAILTMRELIDGYWGLAVNSLDKAKELLATRQMVDTYWEPAVDGQEGK